MEKENQKKETTSSLEEILNSINLEETTKLNIVNYVDDNENDENNNNNNENENENDNNNNNNQHTNNNEQYKLVGQEIISELLGETPNTNSNANSNTNSNNTVILNNKTISQQIQLLSNNIDRRIGNYLLNELEKKKTYIEELEEAVKFQEKEIGELKLKLDTLSKLDLLSKIRSNMDSKLSEFEINMSEEFNSSKEDNIQMSKPNKVVQVIKPQQPNQIKSKITKEEDTQYPRNNPDLVFSSDPGTKVKSIPKEEEEPRYNGIMMLERPKQEEKIKIVLDYETDKNPEEIIKQRRRKARF